ncbi:MAG: DICT sensory domain-containing protein [Halovenus sp.]
MFDSLLTEVQATDKQIVVYRRGQKRDLETRLATHNVAVTRRALPPGGPDPFLVIEEEGEFAGALGLVDLDGLLEPPIAHPGERDDISAGYRALFDVLDETVFSTMERRQLLAVSREIEDRAYRVGTGTLHASFQTLSTFKYQTDVYRELATETDLDIHVYAIADWTPPEIAGITYHEYGDDTHGRYWTLAFDSGGDNSRACGLVAREHSDRYDGVWTYDSELVSDIIAVLTEGRGRP